MATLQTVIEKYRGHRNINKADLGSLTKEQLLELKGLVDTDLSLINHRLGRVRSKAARTGRFSDPEWFRRTELARKLKARLSQAIQEELGKRSREERSANRTDNPSSWTRRLLDAMDVVLTLEQKEEVIRKAKELHQSEQILV